MIGGGYAMSRPKGAIWVEVSLETVTAYTLLSDVNYFHFRFFQLYQWRILIPLGGGTRGELKG